MKRSSTMLATVVIAMTAGTAPIAHAAPERRPAQDQQVFPHGYRGPAISGQPENTREKPGDVLRMLNGAKPLPKSAAGDAHTVTVDVLDRYGSAPQTADAQYVTFTPLNGADPLYGELDNGHLAAHLPPGEYVAATGVYTTEPTGTKSLTVVYLPQVVVDQDRPLLLDARTGRPLSIAVDRPDARLTQGDGGGAYGRVVQTIGGRTINTASFQFTDGRPTYITPTVQAPGLALWITGRLTKNGAVLGSPYIYNVAGTVSDRQIIPTDPVLRARTADLAAVQTRYARQGRPGCAGTHAGALLPGGGLTVGFYAGIGPLPTTRTEYFSPRVDWETHTGIGPEDCAFETVNTAGGTEKFSKPGVYTRDRTTGPFGPGPDHNSLLSDGTLQFWVPMYSTWSAQSGLGGTGTTTLEDANGTIIGTSNESGHGQFQIPVKPATYKATTDAYRQVPWSDLAIRQHVVWTFSTRELDPDWSRAPLLSVLYRTPLDEDNRAPASTQRISLQVRSNQEIPPPSIRKLTLQVSHDEGKTWSGVPLHTTADGWETTVSNPMGASAKYVSFRAFAEDDSGNSVDQTIIRAYGLS